jgi:hypothetical protein
MNIFITTCSKNKIEGGKPHLSYRWRGESRSRMIQVRAKILDMIKSGELKSGLRLPVLGPDFGGCEESGAYLPARKRYSEGSFTRGLLSSKRKLSDWHKTNRVYYLSALYGLAADYEPIQNYDLRLQPSLQSLWREQGEIAGFLMQDLKDSKQACNVIDCTADGDYGSLIYWELPNEAGYVVRHVRGCGELDPGQIRWASGHLAGDKSERLDDLIEYDECRYTTDNGSITLSKEQTTNVHRPSEQGQETETGSPYQAALHCPTIAVAIHRASQKQSFMNHARNRGWSRIVDFEFITDLRKEFLLKLDKHGIKMLIIHVDDTHAHIQKAYKADTVDLISALPKGWEYQKIKHERYSDIELDARVAFRKP